MSKDLIAVMFFYCITENSVEFKCCKSLHVFEHESAAVLVITHLSGPCRACGIEADFAPRIMTQFVQTSHRLQR